MADTKPSLYWHTKTENGWKRFPVLYAKNGRIRKGVVLVDGVERTYAKGTFHLRVSGDRGTWTFRNLGSNAQDALNTRDKETSLRRARKELEGTGATIVDPDVALGPRTLLQARDEFLREQNLHNVKSTLSVYRISIDGFLKHSKLSYAADVRKLDILEYVRHLEDKGFYPQTLFTRSRRLLKFLRYAGVKEDVLPKGKELPKKMEGEPEAYTEEELDRFFTGVDRKYALMFETLLKTGLREKEFMFLEQRDIIITPRQRVIVVRNKPELKFKIKDSEDRVITLEAELAEKLQQHMARHTGRRFLFGTKRDKPRRHLIRILKTEAQRLGLNCGVCRTCRERQECEHWFLHKFRATFATTCLQNGMDPHTVMKQLGHASLEVTMRYLAAAKTERTMKSMDAVWARHKAELVEMPKRDARSA
jgi:integrase